MTSETEFQDLNSCYEVRQNSDMSDLSVKSAFNVIISDTEKTDS